METRNNLLQALDHISLAEIFSYLNTSDVLLHLSLTCKDFHRIVTTSPYIIKSLFENLFGRRITKKEMSNLSFPRFQGILKDLFVANTLQEPLPFFGFRSNSGCDENNYNFLFDKIFEPRENRSIVCTDTGENFDIEGVLSEDFGRETKVLEDLVLSIDQAEIPHASLFKTWLMRYGFEAIELFPLPPNNVLEDKIKPLREFRQEFSNTLFGKSDTYHIELQCQKMMRSIGLIQSCHLNREIESMTCPIKTLAAFASLNEEIRSSQIAYLFNDCKTSDDLLQLLKDHKDNLPDITQTSIKRLAELSHNIQYQDEEEDGVEFVVFNSNGKKRDVIPLFWVNFNRAINKNLFLNFRDCNFSGRNVMLKLIRCEDLKEKFGDTHPGTNIDIKFCSFFGPVIDL